LLKLNKREKILLRILLSIIVIACAGVYYYLKIERLRTLQEQIQLTEQQIKKISLKTPDEVQIAKQRNLLHEELKEEREKLYSSSEIDPYQFSITIRELLAANRLTIKKYQTIEVKENTYLEFSISGDALGLTEFLKSVFSSNKYWYIPFLSVDARKADGSITAVLRITYETIDEENL
jgi:hypothetical protein